MRWIIPEPLVPRQEDRRLGERDWEYSPRRSRGEYSPKITEPEANNCVSIFTHSSEYEK